MKPMFSPQAEIEFQGILGLYPRPEAALLSVLWLAQKEFRGLGVEVRRYVADRLGLSAARVDAVMSFYTMYGAEPRARYRLAVCRNLSCTLCGGGELLEAAKAMLHIEPGMTTQDGMFSLSAVECLAACGGAPVLAVNDDYHENMNEGKLADLLMKLRERG